MNTKHKILSVLLILATMATLCVVMAVPASADVTQPTAPTIAVGTNVIGVATDYTAMAFNITKPLVLGDIVVLKFPAGTNFTAGATTTIAGSAAFGASAVSAGAGSTTNNVITFTATGPVAGGLTLTVATNTSSVTNPTTPGSQTYIVYTSQEVVPVTSLSYTIKGIKVSGGAVTTPTTAAYGTTMTVVGAGYTAGQSLDILQGATLAAAAIIAPNAATVAADGTFTGTFTLTSGTGTIWAKDGAGVCYNTIAVTVLRGISAIDPATGNAGTTITVTGMSFVAGDHVALSFGNDPVSIASVVANCTLNVGAAGLIITAPAATYNTISVTATGTFKATIAIPASSAGIKQIAARCIAAAPATYAAPANFQAVATTGTINYTAVPQDVTLSTATGAVGTSVAISGTGWKSSDTITIQPQTSASVAVGTAVTTTATTTGTFSASVVIASTVGKINVTGAFGGNVSKTFTIPGSTLTLSPASGTVGTVVTVTGAGFPGYGQLTVLAIGAVNVLPIGPSVLADAAGAFTASFTVPSAGLAGNQAVTATLGAVTPATLPNFTITASALPVATGLSSIAGQYSKIWAFDGATQSWKLYDTAPGATSSLTSLVVGQGYWIQVTANCTLTYLGNNYTLYAGWNLIGWR